MSNTHELNIKQALTTAKKLTKQGKISEAINLYKNILKQQPRNLKANKSLKKLQSNQVSNKEVQTPSQDQINVLVNLYNSQNLEETENACKKLLKNCPNSLIVLNIYGAALMGQGKLEEALKTFDKAIEIKPDFAEGYTNRGNVLKDLGQLEEALKSYNKAIKLNPGIVQAYSNLSIVLKDLNRPEQALKSCQKAIELNPNYAQAYFNCAIILLDMDQTNEALNSFDNAIKINPQHFEAYYNRGNLQKELGHLKESLADYDNAIQLKTDFVEAYSNRGNVLKALGRHQDALKSYKKAIEINPYCFEAYINIGNLLSKQGKFNEAVDILQIALRKEPENQRITNCFINVLNYYLPEDNNCGKYVSLQKSLQDVLSENPEKGAISDETVKNLYQACDSAVNSHNLPDSNYPETQIWRGKAFYQGCDRHKVVFNTFNAIPRYCFDCYKVIIEPRNVIELFKLLLVFISIKLPNDNPRKCMVEIRPEISGLYKGLIYCQGFEEAQEILMNTQTGVSESISDKVKVSLKRGCSEFQLAYPEYGQINEDGRCILEYNKDWLDHEDYTDRNLVGHIIPSAFDTYNHQGFTLRDILIMRNWLYYAATNEDKSYKKISETINKKITNFKRPVL